jgi:hypothetical protein
MMPFGFGELLFMFWLLIMGAVPKQVVESGTLIGFPSAADARESDQAI